VFVTQHYRPFVMRVLISQLICVFLRKKWGTGLFLQLPFVFLPRTKVRNVANTTAGRRTNMAVAKDRARMQQVQWDVTAPSRSVVYHRAVEIQCDLRPLSSADLLVSLEWIAVCLPWPWWFYNEDQWPVV